MMNILAFLIFVDVAYAKHVTNVRIHQGKFESILDSPYHAQVTYVKNITIIKGCGGSIVSTLNIITAAHCLNDKYDYVYVQVGSDKKAYGQPFVVSSYKIHPDYNSDTLDSDVAIITLHNPMKYSDSIEPIRLARKIPQLGSMLKVSGWGRLTKNSSALVVRLRSVELPLVNIKECSDMYNVTSNMVCAGYERGPSDCRGDSGGGLVWKRRLVGIVSFGECETGPSVYTNVPALRDWIIANVQWDGRR